MTLDQVRSGWMRSRDLVNSSGDPNTTLEAGTGRLEVGVRE